MSDGYVLAYSHIPPRGLPFAISVWQVQNGVALFMFSGDRSTVNGIEELLEYVKNHEFYGENPVATTSVLEMLELLKHGTSQRFQFVCVNL